MDDEGAVNVASINRSVGAFLSWRSIHVTRLPAVPSSGAEKRGAAGDLVGAHVRDYSEVACGVRNSEHCAFEGCATTRLLMRSTCQVVTESVQQHN